VVICDRLARVKCCFDLGASVWLHRPLASYPAGVACSRVARRSPCRGPFRRPAALACHPGGPWVEHCGRVGSAWFPPWCSGDCTNRRVNLCGVGGWCLGWACGAACPLSKKTSNYNKPITAKGGGLVADSRYQFVSLAHAPLASLWAGRGRQASTCPLARQPSAPDARQIRPPGARPGWHSAVTFPVATPAGAAGLLRIRRPRGAAEAPGRGPPHSWPTGCRQRPAARHRRAALIKKRKSERGSPARQSQ